MGYHRAPRRQEERGLLDREPCAFDGELLRTRPVGRVDLFRGLGDRAGEAVYIGAPQQLGQPAPGVDDQGRALLEQLAGANDGVGGVVRAVEAEEDRTLLA